MDDASLIGDRYEVLERLGAGSAAEVFRVLDAQEGGQKALKLLRAEGEGDPGALGQAFHREFRLLTELRHPHLVRVHDFGCSRWGDDDRDRTWFTMDLIDGRPVADIVPEAGRDPRLLARIADAILDALGALHARGLIHRDVTTSNILVGAEPESEPPPLWLMDLGLVDSDRIASGGVIRGTVATLAPETLRGGRIDGRADLYSLGCVLYELATGQEPFPASSPWDVIGAHLSTKPVPPRQLNPEIPLTLERFVLGLLEKDPARRPATAGEARRAISELSGRRVDRLPPLSEPLSPSLVGRQRESEAFGEALSRLDEERGDALLIQGSLGSGKTRLLEEFRLAARLAGRPAILVRGSDLPRRPFALLDALGEQLLGDRASPVAKDAPRALAERIEELASALGGRPSVVLVDDVQAADGGSRAALAELADQISRRALALVLVLAFSEAASEGTHSLLDELLERGLARLLRLRSLETADVGAMAASMVGRPRLPDSWAAKLHQLSGGMPLLVEELVGSLITSALVNPGAELADEAADLAGLRCGRTRLESVLDETWGGLEPASRAMLAALAVAGGEPLSFPELDRLDPHIALDPEAATPLLAAGLVRRARVQGTAPGLALVGAALAPPILAQIDAGEARTLHRRRAEQLEDLPRSRAQRAKHLVLAGEAERAADLEIEAASLALAEGLPQEATRLIDGLLARDSLDGSPQMQSRARRLRGGALAASGKADDAAREFERAIEAARSSGDPLTLAETLREVGSFQAETNLGAQAIANLEEALALLDELGDTAGGARVLVLMGRLLRDLLRHDDAEERLSSALSQARRAERADIQAEALVALGELALERGAHERAAEHFRAADKESSQAGSEAGRTEARRGKILALEASGRFAEALMEAENLLVGARDAGHVEAEAGALFAVGRLLSRTGRRREAHARLGEAAVLYRRLARPASLVRSLAAQARLLLEQGQSRSAAARMAEAREIARRARVDEHASSAASTGARIEAFLGNTDAVEAAFASLQAAAAMTPGARAERALLLGCAALAGGRTEAARESLQEACFLARRAELPALEAEGLLALAETYVEVREVDRAALALKKVRGWAEAGGGEEILAHCRLVSAEMELAQPGGDIARAREDAELAAQTLADRERGDLAWRAHAALATSARRLGDHEVGDAALAEALAGVEALVGGLPNGLKGRWQQKPRVRSLLEQASGPAREATEERPAAAADGALVREVEETRRLLEINRALNSTLELEDLLRILVDTAIDMTDAERGFVLIDQGGAPQLEMARASGGRDLPEDDRRFSRSVARQVISEDTPLLSHNAQADERLTTAASIHALEIHSILAHPLRVRGDVCGALVVDTRRSAAVFDRGRQDLIGRLADQAGIALGNARLVAELRRQAEQINELNAELTETVEEQRVELVEKQSNLEVRYRFDCIIGASSAMQKSYRAMDKILPTQIPVLVTGESGTGKDLIARVLHYSGPRNSKRFVTVNCAALTDTLLESELFGHRKGAFTGAERDRKGLFEQADGGTLFLDEIGEMPLRLQPKLLRAIQFGEVRRLGEDAPRTVDVRIIAATNRALAEMVREGSFREDLFYRLDVAHVALAPLRERMEDIGLLVNHFLESYAEKNGTEPKTIENAALRLFLRHDWPGNVRELENEITKLAAFGEGDIITELDILEHATFLERSKSRRRTGAASAGVGTLEQAEIEQIRQALRNAKGNRTRAAEMLGIDRSTLYRKLKRLEKDGLL